MQWFNTQRAAAELAVLLEVGVLEANEKKKRRPTELAADDEQWDWMEDDLRHIHHQFSQKNKESGLILYSGKNPTAAHPVFFSARLCS